MSETRSRHMFAALSCDVQMLAEKVCFARIPAEVNLDALAQQWHTKSLQSRAYMQGPTLLQTTNFELKKRNFIDTCKHYDTPHFEMPYVYPEFLKEDKRIFRYVQLQRDLLDDAGSARD